MAKQFWTPDLLCILPKLLLYNYRMSLCCTIKNFQIKRPKPVTPDHCLCLQSKVCEDMVC